MKIVLNLILAVFLLNPYALAQGASDYDQAYEKCEQLASKSVSNDYDDHSWQLEFEKCMKKEGIDTKDFYESGMGE